MNWPSGCRSPGSCSQHRRCMYILCPYENSDIALAVEVAQAVKRIADGDFEEVNPMTADNTIERLSEVLLNAIDEFSEHTRLTTGEAMGALFTVMVQSAQASENYDPKQLVKEVDAKIREAVNLQ